MTEKQQEINCFYPSRGPQWHLNTLLAYSILKHGVLNNLMQSFKHFRNQSMEWTEEHNVFLCREVLLLDPFQYPCRSKERGDV